MTSPLKLVVDLDGTLLKSDMLYESFWSAFALKWHTPLMAFTKLLESKAALKSYLSNESNIDAASLPYDKNVIEYIQSHRAKGGSVALVTATHQVIADQIADHLKIFDEVHGSHDDNNLKGLAKANFLAERFGEGNFCYMGDTASDLPVWKVSGKVVTVNAKETLCRQADAFGKPIEHLKTFTRSWQPYLQALRIHQWSKNILIFLPMLAAQKFDSISFFSSVLAFVAICLVASSVYITNDLLDLNADRSHPRKRSRPLASGILPIAHGNLMALALLSLGFATAAFLGWIFLLAIGSYYFLTVAYSLILKRKIAVDICVLAGLYSMRIVAGGVAANIELSVWLLAFSIFLFLSLGAVKRQTELVDLVKRGELEAKGRGYHAQDLPIISIISLTSGYISVLVMVLYLNSPNILELYQTPQVLWGICCILIYWLTRVVLLTHRGSMHDDPVVFATRDKISQICFVSMLGLVMAGALL